MDLDQKIFDEELSKLAIDYDKFFVASAIGQSLIMQATGGSSFGYIGEIKTV